MINVTKTFLPPFDEYVAVIKKAWDKAWLTNNGELVQELEQKLKEYLGARNFLLCNNGTIALQVALKVLGIHGEVVTTPFSYVASTTAILWENCTPVFVDIDEKTLCIDTAKIEAAITGNTKAILATHVYGNACDINAISHIGEKYGLKIIYDGAHAFGTKYNDESVFNYGDISICSFHATKLFHTAEGGCIITSSDELARGALLYRQFGHIGEEYFSQGINGKNSELHAAMGLCNLNYIDEILEVRKQQWMYYALMLHDTSLQLLEITTGTSYNYAYFPVVFKTESLLLEAMERMKKNEVIPRRYFYPSLNTLPYVDYQPAPVSESIAARVLCLPLFHELAREDQYAIACLVLDTKKQHAV